MSATALCCQNKLVGRALNQIPKEFIENEELRQAIKFALPENYEFEIYKTLWRIRQEKSTHVGLQFPEGLLIFASQIGFILEQFTRHEIEITIFGDVTYGACCIDDLTAKAIGVDLIVHYGHSCLVPIDQTTLKCLYVFVDICFDFNPLLRILEANFPVKPPETFDYSSKRLLSSEREVVDKNITRTDNNLIKDVHYERSPVIALLGTVQYSSVVHAAKERLRVIYGNENVIVPQELPLTAGEVLGCTSPNFELLQVPDICIFVADGRFHLESAMIQNPSVPFFRYDPFLKVLTREGYDFESLHANRLAAIDKAKTASSVGIILGTLGRQGSVGIFERLKGLLESCHVEVTLFLMSEIMPDRLQELATSIGAFIQVACPRLSIDWGHFFNLTPLLTPYEAMVAFGTQTYLDVYPMDFYSHQGGPWTNFKQGHRNGSLAQTAISTLSQLEQRRTRIRQRAEERRNRAEAS